MSKTKINITITGDGQEFVQGTIDNKMYESIQNKAKRDVTSIENIWKQETGFCAEKTLDFEDWYEYNNKAHKWGTFLESTKISIEVNGTTLVEDRLLKDDLETLDNPDDLLIDIGNFDGLCDMSDLNHCLVTAIVNETGFFSVLDFELDEKWDYKKLKYLIFSTDSVGLGYDFGEMVLGIAYNDTKYWFDFNSGGGNMSIYLEYLNKKKIESLNI